MTFENFRPVSKEDNVALAAQWVSINAPLQTSGKRQRAICPRVEGPVEIDCEDREEVAETTAGYPIAA